MLKRLKPTHVDKSAAVEERAEMRTGQREEGVKFRKQVRHLRARHCRTNYQVAQRVTYEAEHTKSGMLFTNKCQYYSEPDAK